MKGFKSTSTNPYSYTQDGVWKKGQYTFQAVVLSDSGYAFAFQRSDTTWQTVDLSWQVKEGSYSKIQWTFTLEVDAVAFRLIANTVTGETIVLQPMLEKGTNGSTPIAHEEDLRGMDGDFHEFIFTRNDTGIAPPTPLSTQENDHVPIDDSVEPPVIWTDNPQGATKELPFEFVSMREKKNGVWLNFSPPSLWAKWAEDGLSVNLHVEGHYNSKWVGVTKVTEIIGGVEVGGSEVVKVSAVFRKGETNIAATEAQSRGFQWYVNNVHLTEFDDQPYITLDETYGDGFADYVVLSYLVNSLREEERREILNVSEGMDGIGEEFIFKAHDDGEVAPVLPQTTDEGYQNDDYHGDWHDDPVAPTEVLQFVWVAKRKKVGGEWQAFGVPSVWTKWVTDGEDSKTLTLSTSSVVMECTSDNQPKAGQTIKVNAKLQNVDGITTFTAIPYNDAGTALPAVVLGSNPYDDNEKTLTSSMWLATYRRVVITATLGVLTDTVTISRLPDGSDGRSPYINTTTNTWWSWNDATGAFTDTGMSPVGSDGAIPYPAGYYESTKWYRREAEYAPYVQYGEVLYLLIKDTPNAGILPTNTTYWKAFNQWEAVFISSLVAQFAKIGGAVFTGDTSNVSSNIRGRLISQKGVNNTNNYNTYTGDSGSWQPKLMLDFETGKAVFDEAKIRGEVEATSGKIAGFAISGTGLSNGPLFNNDAYVVFRNDNNKTFAGIGGNVLPAASGAKAVARFENRATNGYYGATNYAMIVEASGATRNVAINVIGDIALNGVIDGFGMRARRISAGYTLDKNDNYISCYNTTSINVYLPSTANRVDGRTIYVRRMNTANVVVYGNGTSISHGNGVQSTSISLSFMSVNDTAMFVYDGQYWCLNWLQRDPS